MSIRHVVAEGNQVMLQYHMTALHQGNFASAPATHKRVEWDEVSVITFGADGKISDLWFMCEEMRLTTEIGYRLAR